MTISLRRTTASATLLLLLLVSTACGSDENPDDGSGDRDRSGAPASVQPDLADPAGDLDPADLGAGVDEALDALGEDGVTEALGGALTSVLSGAVDHEVVDGRLVVEMEGGAAEGASACLIATTARDGVGGTSPISLRYPDGTVDCD